jgi:hypothetical protein
MPKGLSVTDPVRAISKKRSSGVGCVSAERNPRAKFVTAATNSAHLSHCMPLGTIGCPIPNISEKRILASSYSFAVEAGCSLLEESANTLAQVCGLAAALKGLSLLLELDE